MILCDANNKAFSLHMQCSQEMTTQLNLSMNNQAIRLFSVLTLLIVSISASAQNGTWTNLNANGSASGSWANSANWLNGIIANGSGNAANFGTVTNTTNSIVTLDGAQTVGSLIFGGDAPVTNWIVNASSTNTTLPLSDAINLAVGSGSPIISVTNDTVFNAPIYGTTGFTLNGGGTLILNVANTNGTGQLSGQVVVNQGIVLANNVNAFGMLDSGNNTSGGVVSTNGGTVQVAGSIAINNEFLTLGGTGNGGTNGALYAFSPLTSTTSTRWGLTISNGNSSASAPAIFLVTNATIRIDGAISNVMGALNAFSNQFLVGYITGGSGNWTLTKSGIGTLEFERGANVSNIVVQAGNVYSDDASGFGSVMTWTIDSGAAILTHQNTCFGANASITMDPNSFWDLNVRGTGIVGSDTTAYTQNIGYLNGSGTITSGSMGNTGAQILALHGTAGGNSLFSGTITVSNGVLNITQAGTNTLTLSGTNNYNGITTVTSGTLLVDGVHSGGSNYVVSAGATLGGSGTIIPSSGNTISLSGTLIAGDPNNGGGTLTVSNVTGSGTVIVSNANLTIFAAAGASGSPLTSLYLQNCTNTFTLQGGASIFSSTLSVNGNNNTLNVSIVNPAVGQYPLIGNVSTITGSSGFSGLNLQLPTGVSGYLSNNVNNSSIDLVISSTPSLVWNGTPNGNWDIGTTADWLNGATAATYTQPGGTGPYVIFNDSAAGTTTVNLTTTLNPSGITVSTASKGYTFSGTGSIAGAGTLEMEGSTTLTIANSGANTFSGGVNINSGTVQVGNGGSAGSLGTGPVTDSGSLIFDLNGNSTITNSISGTGSIVQDGTGTITLSSVGSVTGPVTINSGTLALAPSGTISVSGNVTGNGALGMNGPGTVILDDGMVSYSGGTVISNGTLEFNSTLPPLGNISDNGLLALEVGGTLANNVSGSGAVTIANGSAVTYSGANSYAGPTKLLGGAALAATDSSYPAGSTLVLGSTSGNADIGSVTFTSGNPVIGGLAAGGNSQSGDPITLSGNNQTLTINGNISIGNVGPSGAVVYVPVTGSGVSMVINTNGGFIQIGLYNGTSGMNPDDILVDLSAINNFIVNLGTNSNGTNSVFNMGTLDTNPGPPTGATVYNQLNLAADSNSITAGTITIGAGGTQLTPDLRLGPGTNIFNVGTFNIGTGGRDGGTMEFNSGSGGVLISGPEGPSTTANYNQGVNPTTGTSAPFMTAVDFTGGAADLFLGTMLIGDEPSRVGGWTNTFTFAQGVLDANRVSLSQGCHNGTTGVTIMNINGGTASLGPVSLTASAASGTLNISGATVTVNNITSTGSGSSALSLANTTLNLALTNNGNPATAPVTAQGFSTSGSVNLNVNGTNWVVGHFPLISYTGSIGGSGYSALNLVNLPSGVSGYLSNDVANLSVDVEVTSAPPVVNTNPTNITISVSGGNINLSWPQDHIGWLLQTQTNALTTGIGTNWTTVPNSGSVDATNFPINTKNGCVFYRLLYNP